MPEVPGFGLKPLILTPRPEVPAICLPSWGLLSTHSLTLMSCVLRAAAAALAYGADKKEGTVAVYDLGECFGCRSHVTCPAYLALFLAM